LKVAPALSGTLTGLLIFSSLMSCVASISVWHMSYTDTTGIRLVMQHGQFRATPYGGAIYFDYQTGSNVEYQRVGFYHDSHLTDDDFPPHDNLVHSKMKRMIWNIFRCTVFSRHLDLDCTNGISLHDTRVILPIWLIEIVFLVLAGSLFWLSRIMRRRFHGCRSGLCRLCGYDLRASIGRCPECGTAASESEIKRGQTKKEMP
jgi:hypothetical protein